MVPPWVGGMGCIKKQVEQAIESKPRVSSVRHGLFLLQFLPWVSVLSPLEDALLPGS